MKSRLPNVGTTIFTVMSALATERGAVNLGQGFPDFDPDPLLLDAVNGAMRAGYNQYAPLNGWPALRQAVSDKVHALYGRRYDPNTEVMITAGATQAIMTAVFALVHPGDEVIVIEPVYDSYIPSIELAGARAVPVPMTNQYRVDWNRVAAAVTPKTRAIMVNSPHNPSGMILRDADMLALQDIVLKHGLLVISDEVYEHMVFDGEPHQSASKYPGLADRSIVVSSFGKTFHVTGWKVGSVVAPKEIMAEFRKVHQFNVFVTNSVMQAGLASYMQDPQRYLQLPTFYQRKRDFFRAGLARTPFKLYPCEGTFFQLVDYSAVSDKTELEFSKWLTTEIGVAAIPLSAFYQTAVENKTVRFCFAKKEETLTRALERLSRLAA
ncbi:MAG: pyridoxal phosphate-dependent aminotransferase [Burkholderiaceae bacterium]|nr:pyridoxal phosphate-dependent aminotransferase [Burkholderiaceae bacterium]